MAYGPAPDRRQVNCRCSSPAAGRLEFFGVHAHGLLKPKAFIVLKKGYMADEHLFDALKATLPSTQFSTGARSHSTHSFQSMPRSMILRACSCTWAKPCITSSLATGFPATGSGASLWQVMTRLKTFQ